MCIRDRCLKRIREKRKDLMETDGYLDNLLYTRQQTTMTKAKYWRIVEVNVPSFSRHKVVHSPRLGMFSFPWRVCTTLAYRRFNHASTPTFPHLRHLSTDEDSLPVKRRRHLTLLDDAVGWSVQMQCNRSANSRFPCEESPDTFLCNRWESVPDLPTQCCVPVSYTHLDVYKRQLL